MKHIPLTEEQVSKLRQAIDLAQRPNACQYVMPFEEREASEDETAIPSKLVPCCIIGQFAILNGITVETLDSWGRNSILSRGTLLCNDSGSEEYALPDMGVDRYLLSDLQSAWDRGNGIKYLQGEELALAIIARKALLNQYVDIYINEHPQKETP